MKLPFVKTRQSPRTIAKATSAAAVEPPPGLPDAASRSALRAWYEGLSSREAVMRYLSDRMAPGESARGVLGRLRRQCANLARARHRNDLAALFEHPEGDRVRHARAVARAIEVLQEGVVRPNPIFF